MAFEFVPLQAWEQPDLIQFLVKSYQADPSITSFRPDVIHWKYFADHPDWIGPRAFAIKKDGQIAAYAGVWPIPLATSKIEIKGMHLNDWAASRVAVGAGAHLLRKAVAFCDVHLAIGGSEDTRNILPKMGYKVCGELHQYVRVVRPWLHFRTKPNPNWKTPLKFLRNAARSLAGFPSAPQGWQVTNISKFTGAVEEAIRPTGDFVSPRRTAAGLNHLLSCPAARFSGFQVNDSQQLRGYFVLTQIGRQVRIVDIRVNTEDEESWRAMCALATRTAAADPEICEVVAAASIEDRRAAWLKSGFVRFRIDPIFCYDPRNLLRSGVDVNLADNDFCILSDPASPYAT
jgi:hypothetical protein